MNLCIMLFTSKGASHSNFIIPLKNRLGLSQTDTLHINAVIISNPFYH